MKLALSPRQTQRSAPQGPPYVQASLKLCASSARGLTLLPASEHLTFASSRCLERLPAHLLPSCPAVG